MFLFWCVCVCMYVCMYVCVCVLFINISVPLFILFLLADIACVHYWDTEMVGYFNGRKLRTSPIFSRTELQAVFGQMMGYERPLYFENEVVTDDEDQSSVAMSQHQPNSVICTRRP